MTFAEENNKRNTYGS